MDLGASWFAPIAKFYGDVDRLFAISWRNCQIKYKNALHDKDLDIEPELWKTNGDELIYTVVLKEAEHVAYVLAAWMKALRDYRNDLINQNHDLDVKGTAWLAGFPIGNAEVVFATSVLPDVNHYEDEDPKVYHFSLLEKWYLDKNNRSGLIKDYAGPAIDTGFRLSQLATPRKFIISLEIARILSLVRLQDRFCDLFEFRAEQLQMGFDGTTALKGVIGNKPYPIFWIDFLHGDPLTDALDGVQRPNIPNNDHIAQYTKAFIDAHSRYLFHPFIRGCHSEHFKSMPKDYETTLEWLVRRWNEEKKRLEIRWDTVPEPIWSTLAPAGELPNINDNLAAELLAVPQDAST